MALATTSAIWRSTGGDTTRTAIAGSTKLAAPFYVANASASGNVTNVSGGQAVILPANAVVTGVIISTTGTGNIDVGFTPLSGVGPGQITTLGTPVPAGILVNQAITAKTAASTSSAAAGTKMGAVANTTNLVVITSVANSAASGSVSGWIEYFVNDSGAQNV